MDFLLTNSGDITFELFEKDNNPLELSFIVSNTKALSISFYVDTEDYEFKPDKTSLSLSFYVDNPSYNKTITIANKDELYEQQINIRLRTVLGDMKSYESLGSKLETMKHKYIDDLISGIELEEEIKRSLIDIIPECEVFISLKEGIYYGYKDCIEITIEDITNRNTYNYKI